MLVDEYLTQVVSIRVTGCASWPWNVLFCTFCILYNLHGYNVEHITSHHMCSNETNTFNGLTWSCLNIWRYKNELDGSEQLIRFDTRAEMCEGAVRVHSAAEDMDASERSAQLIIKDGLTSYSIFGVDWTLIAELRGLSENNFNRQTVQPASSLMLPSRRAVLYPVSTHWCISSSADAMGVCQVSPAAWHSSHSQRAAAPQTMMHKRWQTPLFCCSVIFF